MTTARITFCKLAGSTLVVKGRLDYSYTEIFLTGKHKVIPGKGWTCVVEKLGTHWTILRRTVAK